MLSDKQKLRLLAKSFSRSGIDRLLVADFSQFDSMIDNLELSFDLSMTYWDVLSESYQILRSDYQNEYVYKNEFLNQVLIKSITGTSDKIFSEFRLGAARADLAVFGEISTAYEIKTALDKEVRLAGQLSTYHQVFNKVYLVVSQGDLQRYLAYDSKVGVIAYDSVKNLFTIYRQAITDTQIDPKTLMSMLHTKEYLSICKSYHKVLPVMNDFERYSICSELLRSIPLDILDRLFVSIMRDRAKNNQFFKNEFIELNQVCLALSLTQKKRNILINNLNQKIREGAGLCK